MRVAAAVLHYRSWPGVRQTLDALLAQTRPPDEVFVFDHASGDGSAEQIRAAFPGLDVIEAAENHGPVAGLNQVLRELLSRGSDAVFTLTDGARLAPDALAHLVQRLEGDPQLGAVGPILVHQENPERVFFGGGYVDRRTWHVELRERPEGVSEWRGRPPHEVDWLDGGTLLLRSETARQAGFMREEFWYHYDDPEYLSRVRSLGWRLEVMPAAVASVNPGHCSVYLEARNRLGFVAWSAPRRLLARELLRAAYIPVRGTLLPRHPLERAEAWPRLRGLVDFLRGRWGEPSASMKTGRHG